MDGLYHSLLKFYVINFHIVIEVKWLNIDLSI